MKPKIGIQLYSLRKNCEENLENVFKVLSEAGYDGVELYSFYNVKAEKMKQMLEKYSLKAMGTHTNIDAIKNNLDDLAAYCTAIGGKYITIAYYSSDRAEDWKELGEILDKAGEKLQKSGLTLLYHNHAHEFKPLKSGELPIDVILNNASPKNLSLELDCYWVKDADTEPAIYLEKNLDRIKTVHLKDMDNNSRMTEVGTGIIDLAGIYKTCKIAGFDWVVIEQDNIYIEPFESVRISLDNAKKFE